MNRSRLVALRAPALGVFAVGALLLAGCAPSDNSTAPGSTAPDASGAGSTAPASGAGGEATSLTVWSWRVEDQAAYDKIFDEYEAAHPGVTVNFKTFKATEYNTILKTGLEGSEGPDVAQVRSYGQLQPTVPNLVPLDGKVDLAGWDENVVKSAQGKADGKLYAVPLAVQTLQMYYNTELFTKAGIAEPPKTWADFTAAMDKLKAANLTPLAVGAKDGWTLPIVHQVLTTPRFGGAAFEKDVLAGTKKLDDPAFAASLDVLKKTQDYMPKNVTAVAYTDAQTMFTSGAAAMFPGGSFELGFFTKQNPNLKLGVFQVPAPEGSPDPKPVTAGYADGAFGISNKSTKQEAALELVKWMATKEFGQKVVDEVKQLSAVPGVSYADPLMQQMFDGYKNSPAPYMMLVDFRYGTPSGTDELAKGIQGIFLGQKDGATAAKELQTAMATWFKPGS